MPFIRNWIGCSGLGTMLANNSKKPGAYELFCLPLKLLGSDGAPARAILVGK
ncbi:MAG: hypothetical protein FD146_861 [Anaerolineaceae bacterium]|nr:MAG: hypothetical protein FD146_861 [Anaerolineaceae bacterium]